jgi:hemerythrin-like domain-containing protein
MTATEQLEAEHKGIKLMLRIIEKMCEQLNSGDDVPPEHLEQVLEFLKVFADKCHHAKEEELLFPALEKVGVSREEGPIGVMLAEHNKARECVKGIDEAIVRYKAGDKSAAAKIVENGMAYIRLLAAHIDKEDYVLYPVADAKLPKDVQDDLLAKFDEVEIQKIGAGKHEQFHKMLENMERVYLK